MKMDWLRMERKLREALDNAIKDGKGQIFDCPQDSACRTLALISEIIGEETGRGFPINQDGTKGI